MNLLNRHRCTRIVHKALAEVRPQFRLHYRHGVHGVPHWSRVWFHGRHLAESMDVDPAILAWFAYLHDSQRHNDDRDPHHGHRAADFASRLRRSRVITELDDPSFERLCEAMRLHSDGHVEGDPALRACWDADRLDLWRVGIDPDPERLCTAHARKPEVLKRANRMAEASFGFAWKPARQRSGTLAGRQSQAVEALALPGCLRPPDSDLPLRAAVSADAGRAALFLVGPLRLPSSDQAPNQRQAVPKQLDAGSLQKQLSHP